MNVALELPKEEAAQVLADAALENIDAELFEPKRFDGATAIAVLVVPLIPATLTFLSKIIMARIASNRHVKVKANGVEIQGLGAADTRKVLADLLADKEDATDA